MSTRLFTFGRSLGETDIKATLREHPAGDVTLGQVAGRPASASIASRWGS
jgi:hypothetical protein